jgi:TonB-linked SusC/RagA family outer membrane protein
MKHFYKTSALLLFCVFIAQLGFAQTEATIKSRLSGRVLEATGKQPLSGVVVRIKGVTNATTTDNEGRFNLVTGQSFPYTLIVSYVGYVTQEVIAKGSPIEIILKENINQLNDVIVTGYSTQERKYIAGSIASVSGDVIKDQPVAGFNQLLQGKATGVQVLSNSGVPGGGITFRIRGNNSINASVDPLYIVDGVFLSNSDPVSTFGNQSGSNPIADLNANDIESIQILKDANATAIYGSLGANGVIIVTTKRGKRNTKGKINFNTYQGWSSAIKKFKVTDGPQTALLANESKNNTAAETSIPATGLIANPESLPTFDRTDDLFRNARSQSYDLSAQGGNETSDYYIAAGYLNQESIVKPSDYTRYTTRLNYDNNLTKKLKVGTSVNISRSVRNLSGSDNNPQGVINSALFVRSYLPVFNADGTYARYGSFDNHLALIANLDNQSVGWRTIANVFGEYSFSPYLKLRSSWSLDNENENYNSYANTLISAGIATNGSATSSITQNYVYTNEQVLTFIKSFGLKYSNQQQHQQQWYWFCC